MPSKSLKINTYWRNIKISSCFNFWKLDHFSDSSLLKKIFYTRKTLENKPFVLFFPITSSFSLWCQSQMWIQGVFYWTLTLFQSEKFQPEHSQYKCCSWESLSNKIVIARLYSLGLWTKHGSIASIKTAHVTNVLRIVLSCMCYMCMPWYHYGRYFYTQSWLIKVHLFYQWLESHGPNLLGIR